MGFGQVGSDYWLGLEKLHQLTTGANYKVRIEVHTISTNEVRWLQMNVFSVASEAQLYKLTWSGQTGSEWMMIDADTVHNGMVFSTEDNNNNVGCTKNCPKLLGGGWWFNCCFQICIVCTLSFNGCTTADIQNGFTDRL